MRSRGAIHVALFFFNNSTTYAHFPTHPLRHLNYLLTYGIVSVLLFFLFWLYISWVVFLYGLKFITLLEGEASS